MISAALQIVPRALIYKFMQCNELLLSQTSFGCIRDSSGYWPTFENIQKQLSHTENVPEYVQDVSK